MRIKEKTGLCRTIGHARKILRMMTLKLVFPDRGHHGLKQFLRVMKLVILIMTVFLLQVSASTKAQISIHVKQESLRKVLEQISKQSGYDLIYTVQDFKGAKPVSINLDNVSVERALEISFTGQPLVYEISDKTVMIKKKVEKGFLEQVSELFKQQIITGKVRDQSDLPIPGVSVRVKGTDRTSVTDKNGSYSIRAAENEVLVYTFVGYTTQEEVVGKQAVIDVKLTESIRKLEQVNVVVNTGYQALPKERTTGSFVVIDSTLLNRKVSTNIMERIDGVAPGVYFNGLTNDRPATTSANRNVGITIRGQNSFNSTAAYPLIVVDNFPYEGEINNINPNDIESVYILKDAAAASIWGARAGNGVIVITTKKGKLNNRMKVEINSNVTIIDKPNLTAHPKYLNSASYIEVEKNLFDMGYFDSDLTNQTTRLTVSPAVEGFAKLRDAKSMMDSLNILSEVDALRDLDVRNDYDNYIYRKAINQQYSIGLRGGTERTTYSISSGYDRNIKQLIGNSYERFTINTINTFAPSKNIEFTAAINISRNSNVQNNDFEFGTYQGVGGKYLSVFPYARLADEGGSPEAVPQGFRMSYLEGMENQGFLDWHYRPLRDIKDRNYQQQINSVMTRFSGKYKFIPQLNMEVQYQLERQDIEDRNFNSVDTYYTRNLINKFTQINSSTGKLDYIFPYGGILNFNRFEKKSNNIRGQFNFNQEWDNHELIAIIGGEAREITNEGNSQTSYGYDDQFGTSVSTLDFVTYFKQNPSGTARIPSMPSGLIGFTNRFISYYSNIAYSFKNRYTLNLSGRKDGANIFGAKTNDKITPLWSVGFGWDISKENFFQIDQLSYLKLRGTYGFNGNVNQEGSALMTGTYGIESITQVKRIANISAPNPQLRWEKIKNINIGLDFSSFQNRISGTFEWYIKNGFDLFQPTDLAPQTGFVTYVANAGNSRSKGIDLILNTKNIIGKFKWSSSLLMGTLSDKVIRYDPKWTSTSARTTSWAVGYPMFAAFSYRWAGLNPENGNPRGYLNGKISEDYSGIFNNFETDSLVYSGTKRPKVFGYLRNDFIYKSLSLSINIGYKFGHIFRRPTVSLNYRDILLIGQHKDYTQRWQKTGDESNTNVPSLVYPNNASRNTFYEYSDVLIEKADHIRFQDIKLSYHLTGTQIGIKGIPSLNFYAYANNLGIIWRSNKHNIDPDAVYGIPNPLSVSFGIQTSL